jgi:tetratricopeptide (TPR) repeat protein
MRPQASVDDVRARRWRLLWLASACLAVTWGVPAAEPPAAKPLTAAQQARLKERDRYGDQTDKLRRAGKLVEAIAAAQKMLAIEREVFGDLHEDVIGSLQQIAEMHESREDFVAARQVRREVWDLRKKMHGESDWRVSDARLGVEDVERLAGLEADKRRQLRQASELNQQVERLWQQGRAREALPLARQAVAIRVQILGKKHPDYAQSLNNLAVLYQTVGDYPKALELFQRARDLRKQLLTENHPHYAQSLNNLAGLCQAMGDYPKGLELYQQARDLYKRRLTENHPLYANCLNNLAQLYRDMGDYLKALELLQQASDLRKRLLTENDPHYANSLNNLAGLYQAMGDYPKALELFLQARDLRKRLLTENHPHYATSLNNLAGLCQAMGDYAKALELFQQAQDLRKQLLTENHPDYAHSLFNLAGLYQAMGDYPKVLELFLQARDLYKRRLTENHPLYANCLSSLAGLYQDLGDYPQALELYQQARNLYKGLQMENHPHYVTYLSSLAGLYRDLGDYPQALELYQQARNLVKGLQMENHPSYATSLHDLAHLYQAMGNYPKALELYQQARNLYEGLQMENHPHYATSLHNLARLYRDMGNYPKALELFQQAHNLVKRRLTENHPHYATSLHNLAGLYRDMGDYPKALELFQQARDLYKRRLTENHPHYANCLHNLARLYQAMGQPAEALPLLQQALTIRQAHLDYTFSALSDRQRLDFLKQLKSSVNAYLSMAPAADLPPARLTATVLAWKGVATARQAEDRLAWDQPDLLPRVERLRQVRAGLAQVANNLPKTAEQQPDWLKRFDDLEKEKDQLESDLAQQSAAYRRVRALRQAGAGQVAQALPPRTALVDFLEYTHSEATLKEKPPLPVVGASTVGLLGAPLGPGPVLAASALLPGKTEQRKLLAFVLVQGRDPVLIPLGASKAIEQAVQDWRQAVVHYDPPDTAAAELARLVWQPLRPHLDGLGTVLIAPDGPLCRLPFAALPGRRPGSYLVHDLAIGYVTSGRHLLELATDTDRLAGRSLLAVGDLDYGAAPAAPAPGLLPIDPRRTAWPPLPGTRGEVESTARRFRQAFPQEPGPRLVTGAEGDAARLKRELTPAAGSPRWAYVHLASHTFFEPPLSASRRAAGEPASFESDREQRTFARNPLLRSRLVLAGANQSLDRGYVTGEEVAGLDLRGVELVVLSACETGLGKVESGEGVFGLHRAFQAAGARTLVASLWQVDDAATSVLMEEFYANLWEKKLPKLEALRRAQVTVLEDRARVTQRAKELSARRGGGAEPQDVPDRIKPGAVSSSPPAWWAAFVLHGDIGAVGPDSGAMEGADSVPGAAPGPRRWPSLVLVGAGLLVGAVLLGGGVLWQRRRHRSGRGCQGPADG